MLFMLSFVFFEFCSNYSILLFCFLLFLFLTGVVSSGVDVFICCGGVCWVVGWVYFLEIYFSIICIIVLSFCWI